MFVAPGLVEIERLGIPDTPGGGLVGHIDQIVAIVVDVPCVCVCVRVKGKDVQYPMCVSHR